MPALQLVLGLTYDLIRDDKYRYFRCPSHHGVFMPFFEFLRSQNLVRGLTPQEVDALKQKVVSITCSSCGAPIDLQTQTKCESCGSGLAIVDLDHLGDALRQLDADARAAAPAIGAPPPMPPDEIIADWRADQEARRRLEAGDDDDDVERPDRSARRRRDAAVAVAWQVTKDTDLRGRRLTRKVTDQIRKRSVTDQRGRTRTSALHEE